MKMLIVSLLVCAMMALTRAAALPEAEAGNGTINELMVPLIQDELEAGNGLVPLIQDEVVKCNHRINIIPAEGFISKAIRTCPCGWIEFRGRCFYYEPTATSWSEAQRNCQSLGANLASAHSIEELQLIQRIILLHTHWNPPTWLGGSDSETEGVWRWQDGTPFDFTHWCPGEPNDGGNQDCLQIIQIEDGRCWDDAGCYVHLPSVCVRGL